MIGKIQKLKNKKGFTLVELIVVIAIIAVLTAVIVPLVGRYAAQATYTTLQDAAKTVANTTSTVLADVTRLGTVYSGGDIKGSKSGDKLTINCGDSDFAEKLQNALEEAVPDGATFFIGVSDNTVSCVIYSTAVTIDQKVTVAEGDFDESYTYSSKPVGIYGNVDVTKKSE